MTSLLDMFHSRDVPFPRDVAFLLDVSFLWGVFHSRDVPFPRDVAFLLDGPFSGVCSILEMYSFPEIWPFY